jgi:glycosyltransferase involved in cell wall biosynthesis
MMKTFNSEGGEKKVAYVSTYPPRECGIATFTKDLIDSMDRLNKFKPPVVVAVNEEETFYNYDQRVKYQIQRNYIEDYIQSARYVNLSKADVVNLQHEFGLFGGDWGEYIISFLENLQKPLVITLHTIVSNFGEKPRGIVESLAHHSSLMVVMTKKAQQLLEKYGIPSEKIEVIQHGCPDIPFTLSEKIKPSLGLSGLIVLSTFGLINRGKGIEYTIQALPSIVEKHPNVLYLIIGETHPEVRKIEGERYRKRLMNLVNKLGLGKHVRFHNRFLTKRELIKYLQATDIYITPYIEPNQISSGTLVYALGAGKAIVSTPYLHAKEVLADGRGLLCKFKDAASLAKCITQLIEDEKLRRSMEKRAYDYSRGFVWSRVAKAYMRLFQRVSKHERH